MALAAQANAGSLLQLRLQLWEAYCQVRYLCSHLRGNDSADSAVSTDSSMDESSETSSAKDVPAGSLRAALSELKRLIQNVLDGADSTVSWWHREALPCACRLAQSLLQVLLEALLSQETSSLRWEITEHSPVFVSQVVSQEPSMRGFSLKCSDHLKFQAHTTVIGLGVVLEN